MAGGEELLLDDSVRLAERAKVKGVRTELEIVPGMIHVWPFYAEWTPEGRSALERIGAFFRTVLTRQ